MPISNGTYSRGREAKIKGKAEKATQDKARYTQTDKFIVKFTKNQVEFEKTRTFY